MSVIQIRALGAQIYSWLMTRVRLHPYRPELHYMRGPGPKCAERHVSRAGVVTTR